jgi:hypothetical protein
MQKFKDVIIQDFWWEDEFDSLLHEYSREEIQSAELKLFIIKIINAETGDTYIKG